MPHIHTEPEQHDITVSAWIFREFAGERKVFVHMHRKIQKYMEVGGHVELNETPWQTVAHELVEESGYALDELEIYQPEYMPQAMEGWTVHPVPVLLNTYQPVPGHYHTDICYAFYADHPPKHTPVEGESQDVQWFTLDELKDEAARGVVLLDIVNAYRTIAHVVDKPYFHRVATKAYSLGKPDINEDALEKTVSGTILALTKFGNPILRAAARQLTPEEIGSHEIQELISNIRYTNRMKQYGVGLAAPQVGVGIALSVIGIKPTPTRPNLEPFDQVIINPAYEGIGQRSGMWEGCQSCGTGDDTLYGKALRYKDIQAVWYDEQATYHKEKLTGFVAHVFQHETDHVQGILFTDRVKDVSSYMMGDEYRKRVVNESKD